MHVTDKKPPNLNNCIWFKNKSFAFVYIPKVACTSWKLYLLLVSGKKLSNDLNLKNIHSESYLHLPIVGAMAPNQRKEFTNQLNRGQIKCLTVIREPRARILSAYLDKILFHQNIESKFSQNIIPNIQNTIKNKEHRPTFLEFLEWCDKQGEAEHWNLHWRPMVNIIGKNQNINISTTEELSETVNEINNIFKTNIDFPDIRALGKRKTYNSNNQINKYYGQQEDIIFNRLYKEDLILYNNIKQRSRNSR